MNRRRLIWQLIGLACGIAALFLQAYMIGERIADRMERTR